mmetsp:Transcript_16514/g.33739  ORF Transcript_16514/g.33739 Transcript_16514/m.33739 type:complete len:300 (-) Transcript_16514:368-1267(-)
MDNSNDYILGIDEAGRGPVLGPMVYAAAFCRRSDSERLRAMGCDDSKVLTPEKREAIRSELERVPNDGETWFHFEVLHISAAEISEKMLRKAKVSLNDISHDAALQLVDKVVMDQGYPIREVYVDTVGPPEPYAQKFRKRYPFLRRVVVTKKADSLYSIVSAASICAKTERDRSMDTARTSGLVGSGYPADPVTRAWMQENLHPFFGYPDLVRFSWGTTVELMKSRAIPIFWDSGDSETGSKRQAFCIEKFLKPRSAKRNSTEANENTCTTEDLSPSIPLVSVPRYLARVDLKRTDKLN